MGRLSEYFDQHRDNLEDAVSTVLAKADATIETLDKKVRELEQKLRDVAGDAPSTTDLNRQNAEGVTTSETTDQGAKKQTRTKR